MEPRLAPRASAQLTALGLGRVLVGLRFQQRSTTRAQRKARSRSGLRMWRVSLYQKRNSALLSVCGRCSWGFGYCSCRVCVSVSGVLFSVGVCVCDLLIFLHFKALLWESITLLCPTCKAYPIVIRSTTRAQREARSRSGLRVWRGRRGGVRRRIHSISRRNELVVDKFNLSQVVYG